MISANSEEAALSSSGESEVDQTQYRKCDEITPVTADSSHALATPEAKVITVRLGTTPTFVTFTLDIKGYARQQRILRLNQELDRLHRLW